VPASRDSRLRAEIDALALALAGTNATTGVLGCARRLAETEIEYRRACDYRDRQLARAIAESSTSSRDAVRELAAVTRYVRRAASKAKFALRAFETQCRR
jgi:hypothetical protein